eukprot:scaffold90221_cov42-Cyclotella_meneghiniana.AAC.2
MERQNCECCLTVVRDGSSASGAVFDGRGQGLHAQVESHVKSCDECQRHKIVGKPNYGEVPETPPQREKDPFEKVHVDCAGQWKVKVTDGVTTEEYTIHIMTMVDAGTK